MTNWFSARRTTENVTNEIEFFWFCFVQVRKREQLLDVRTTSWWERMCEKCQLNPINKPFELTHIFVVPLRRCIWNWKYVCRHHWFPFWGRHKYKRRNSGDFLFCFSFLAKFTMRCLSHHHTLKATLAAICIRIILSEMDVCARLVQFGLSHVIRLRW